MMAAPSRIVMPHELAGTRFRICCHSGAMIARLVGLRRSLVSTVDGVFCVPAATRRSRRVQPCAQPLTVETTSMNSIPADSNLPAKQDLVLILVVNPLRVMLDRSGSYSIYPSWAASMVAQRPNCRALPGIRRLRPPRLLGRIALRNPVLRSQSPKSPTTILGFPVI
jgi:hypothetical protein